MAFPKNGVVEAVKIVPSAFGLLAVIKPENSADENHWVRGFSQEWESDLYALKNVDDTNINETQIAGAGNVNYYDKIDPFFVEVEETRSTLGFLGIDRIARIKRQVEAASQRAIEQELWDGAVRIATGHENRALISYGCQIVGGSGLSPKRALAALEQGIAEVSHAGEQGIIHCTRDVVALLSSNSQMLFHNKDVDHLQTMGGTPVIVGSGYSGNGPKIPVASGSAISSTKVVTINTSSPHGLVTGDLIYFVVDGETIDYSTTTGAGVSVTVVDSDTVTVVVGSVPSNISLEDATGYVQMRADTENKWIYATGTVRVYLGDVDVVNDNLAQGYDVAGNQNDITLKAIRPAAVYFDTSIHLAVRVDLTA
jgi:hypothetical protein